MDRDDFPLSVKDILAKRVGLRCSNPNCKKLTSGPRTDESKAVNVGVAAHITAASPNGPRYDPELTREERKSAGNGIWLCGVCAKLVDNDPVRFPVEILQQWKRSAEATTLAEIEGADPNKASEGNVIIDISYKAVRRSQERHDYQLIIGLKNCTNNIIDSYHVDLEMPARIIEQPEKIFLYVENRSNRDTSFFRVVSSLHHPGDKIYPRDQKVILNIDYFMDHNIYFNRGDLFNFLVRATLYLPGQRPIINEKMFQDLQNF